MQDSHLHLQDPRFTDPAAIITDMQQAGITNCVVNGTSPADWDQVTALAEKFPEFVLPNYGLHPWHTPCAESNWKELLEKKLADNPLAGIGECGLDRWIKSPDKPAQEDAFLFQLELANRLNRPLTIHILKAWNWFMDILRTQQFPQRNFLLHAYNGSHELVQELTERGAYFSFSGSFLASNKSRQLETFRRVPLDRLLVETDAPDMLPPAEAISHKVTGEPKLNHPANLPRIIHQLALELTIDPTTLKKQLDTNFSQFFLSQ